jgi:opacity protein-like surface antigen
MIVRPGVVVIVAVLTLAALAPPVSAFDADQAFAKGTYVLSGEGVYGQQFNLEGVVHESDIEFWGLGLRASMLPFGPTGPGAVRGALEVGLEPYYQRYTEPQSAFWAGLGLVLRYHFLALGRLVPYVEVAAGAGGTDLKVKEIDSSFAFVVWGGVGASFFVTDSTAIYAGYRLEHVSNGNTSEPNRGFESHVGVLGMSYYFR